MIFDNGTHAISWLMSETSTVYSAASTTGKIIDMLQGLVSQGGGGEECGVDDKNNARMDLEKLLLDKMEIREVELMIIFMLDGINETIKLIKSSPDWKAWRDKYKSALDRGSMTYSKLIYGILDKWEKVLIEADYMGEK